MIPYSEMVIPYSDPLTKFMRMIHDDNFQYHHKHYCQKLDNDSGQSKALIDCPALCQMLQV